MLSWLSPSSRFSLYYPNLPPTLLLNAYQTTTPYNRNKNPQLP